MKNILPVVEYYGFSEIGPIREDNQDSIQLPNGKCPPEEEMLFAVADGMGGYAQGALASKLTLETFKKTVLEHHKPDKKAFRRGINEANLCVYKTAEHLGAGRMGSTLTAALVLGNNLLMAHIGDSRAYLIRDKQSVCLTADHTVVGDLVRAKLIPGEKIRTHAQRSILTKAVGIGLFAHPDVFSVKIQQDDYFVLCSDGVWSVIQDHEFARVVEESHGIDQVSLNIIKLAMDRETDDNASVVAFHIQELSPASDEEKRFSLSSRFTSGKR